MASSPPSKTQSSATDSSSERQRLSDEESELNNTTVDRISGLPDSLLCDILSLLPTKHAVATSILSTRWKYVWTSVPNLDFDDAAKLFEERPNRDQEVYTSFIHFVYKVLALHISSRVKKFRLHCGENHDVLHLGTWIRAAVMLDVEELDLRLRIEPLIGFRLFTSDTLKVLKLSSDIVLDVSSSVTLPSLKILHLIAVRFRNDDSVRNLFAGCPVLEELVLDRSNSDNVRNFNLFAPTLKHLTIAIVEKNLLKYRSCKLEINAPALEYFNLSLSNHACEHVSIVNLSSLVEAHVDVHLHSVGPQEYESHGKCLVDLFHGLCSFKFLFLTNNTIEYLRFVSFDAPPLFRNLIRLEAHVNCCGWHVLPDLLEGSCNLEDLVLEKGTIHREHTSRLRWPKCVPEYLSHLTTVDIRGFEGLKDELKLVEYILKNAEALKTMKICFCQPNLEGILEKISMFPRGSKMCQVAFS